MNNELENQVNKAVKNYFESGRYEEVLQESVNKALDEVVKDMFRSYGHVGKQLNEIVKEKIRIDQNAVEMPEFNKMLTQLVQTNLSDTLQKNSHDLIKESLEEVFQPAEKEIEISDIIRSYIKKEFDGGCVCEDDKITYILEECQYGVTLKMWKGNSTAKKLFEDKEYNKEPDINVYMSYCHDDELDKDLKHARIGIIRNKSNFNYETSNFGFDARLYLWYCARTIITGINREDVNEEIIVYVNEYID